MKIRLALEKKRNKVLSIREKCNKNQASRGLVEQNIGQQGQNATKKTSSSKSGQHGKNDTKNQASMGKMIPKIRLAGAK